MVAVITSLLEKISFSSEAADNARNVRIREMMQPSETRLAPHRIRSNIQPTINNTDITTDSNANHTDIALRLNSYGTSHHGHRNLLPDDHNQMPTDGTVYTISDTSAATHRPPQYNSLIDDYHASPSQFHNTRPYPVHSLGPDARTQHGLSQPGNQMVRPETPPPTYQDYISGATAATFV